MTRRLMLCDCEGTMMLDAGAIGAATGMTCGRTCTALCTTEIGRAADALRGTDPVTIACAQEAPAFAALAEELGVAAPACIDVRDRAGWSDEAGAAAPKIAALLTVPAPPPAAVLDVTSGGIALVVGDPDVALAAADRLAETLSVTCLLTREADILPGPERRFDVALGRLRTATGAFGGFAVSVEGFRALDPGGRGPLRFGRPQERVESACDIIVDLRGDGPLFPADHKRDGYLRADPRDPAAVARAVFDASHLVGTFEKTLHVRLDESLCAHSRAGQTGCTRCLTVCPTGAITPAGDVVSVDPMICAGCGACSAVCPSQAIGYDAPPVDWVLGHLRRLAAAFLAAGGTAPRLLVHDDGHGREMIALAARLGRGLPADVLPLELPALNAFGHAEMLVALACGFAEIAILPSPRTERETLEAQIAIAAALTEGVGIGTGRVRLVDADDPDTLAEALREAAPEALRVEPILPLGRRRDATRLAARALAGDARPTIPLPAGAPYGAVLVDRDACTLCLACVGLCPSGALGDDPDKPVLTFREDACLQCGLCANVCPEDAISYAPRLDLSDEALRLRVLNEEEPALCIECGKPFGVKSTIERIVSRLEGRHAMFTGSDNARLIRMCDDCRVNATYHARAAPFRLGDRPRPRSTDDYLRDREKS